jgi:site-specific DNA-methyltransferase (adenine-specific)
MTLDEIIDAIGVTPFHREDAGVIYCADCLSILPKIPAGAIDLIVTSPPYNVRMEYESELEWPVYFDFLSAATKSMAMALRDGGILAVNLPKDVKLTKNDIARDRVRVVRIAERFDTICENDLGLLPRENIIWIKSNVEGQVYSHVSATGSDNNLYIRSVCEVITLHSKARYYCDGGTGRRGKEAVPFTDETKDIWWIMPERSNGHPCPFPILIPHRLINMFTIPRKQERIVLDPFIGGGTTALAAKQLKRKFIGIERREDYCRIAVDRLRQGVLGL